MPSTVRGQQRERDHSFAALTLAFHFTHQFLLKHVRHRHLARSDLIRACPHKTKLAMRQPLAFAGLHPHRRTKDTAGHRPRSVHIASPGRGIKRRTGRIIRELLKALLISLGVANQPGSQIAGKFSTMLVDPCSSPAFDLRRQLRLRVSQRCHSRAQPQHIELVDRKHPITTLRATHAAHQPIAGLPRRFSQRRIHDLHEFPVAGRQSHGARIRDLDPVRRGL